VEGEGEGDAEVDILEGGKRRPYGRRVGGVGRGVGRFVFLIPGVGERGEKGGGWFYERTTHDDRVYRYGGREGRVLAATAGGQEEEGGCLSTADLKPDRDAHPLAPLLALQPEIETDSHWLLHIGIYTGLHFSSPLDQADTTDLGAMNIPHLHISSMNMPHLPASPRLAVHMRHRVQQVFSAHTRN
jgi:hypothetical protein